MYLVVVAIDARLGVYLILGVNEGEALVLPNAGEVYTEIEIRSHAIRQRLLSTEEIFLLHHTGCGTCSLTDDELKQSVEDETGTGHSGLPNPCVGLRRILRAEIGSIKSSSSTSQRESPTRRLSSAIPRQDSPAGLCRIRLA